MRIDLLPAWTLTNLQPAFYDSESATVLQQMSKVYAKMQELLEDYNSFVKDINTTIDDFQNGIISDFDCFKNCIIKTMNDYISSIDTKINLQDSNIANKFSEQDTVIENAINYMKDNIVQTTTDVINQAIQDGTMRAELVEEYNPLTETLTLNSLNLSIEPEGGE